MHRNDSDSRVYYYQVHTFVHTFCRNDLNKVKFTPPPSGIYRLPFIRTNVLILAQGHEALTSHLDTTINGDA